MKASNPFGLTVREMEALKLVAEGKSNPDIAHEMGIEVGSVETLLTIAYRKIGVNNRLAALRFCMKNVARLGLTDLM